jgi:hypothetical protein
LIQLIAAFILKVLHRVLIHMSIRFRF